MILNKYDYIEEPISTTIQSNTTTPLKMTYTWNELKQLPFLNNTKSFKRSPNVQRDYNECLATKTNDGCNPLNPYELYDELKTELPENQRIENTNQYCFCRNTYPYNFKNGIKHYLLWFSPHYNNNNNPTFKKKIYDKHFIESLVTTFIDKNFTGSDYVIFQNSLNNKSVPMLEHFHILIK